MNRRPDRQRGVALIEMAGMLLVAVPMLAALVVFGRLTWHIIVVEKAVSGAARMVEALPPESFAVDTASADLPDLVYTYIGDAAAAAGIVPGMTARDVVLTCDQFACRGPVLASVSVAATSTYLDTVFSGAYTQAFAIPDRLLVKSNYEQTYAPPVYPIRALPAAN